MNELAIIIPAYKSQYLKEALNSLVNQTDKRFAVYIGDDNSPFSLDKIVNEFKSILSIKYVKFSNNIGAKNLVEQWARCVALSTVEKWLWLFSDDDIADCYCVERFYETTKKASGKYDIFRFNTTVIDQTGKIIFDNPIGPEVESSLEMAYHLLLGKRGNSMPDHIFSRNIYESSGGFVNTQYAQGADWATSIKFSKEKGIRIIPEAKLFWRYSGINISSLAFQSKEEMFRGYFEFFSWICEHFKYLQNKKSNISYEDMMSANIEKLKMVLISHYGGINKKMIFPLIKLLSRNLKLDFLSIIEFIYSVNKRRD